jgi:hypothetical protein
LFSALQSDPADVTLGVSLTPFASRLIPRHLQLRRAQMTCCVPCCPLAAMRASLEQRPVQWTDLLCAPMPYTNRQVRDCDQVSNIFSDRHGTGQLSSARLGIIWI